MINEIACDLCQDFEFNKCGAHYPCEKLIAEIDLVGIVYKPNNNNDPITKNSEARVIRYKQKEKQEFFHLAFSLASKTKLTPVTTSELNILGRQLKDKNFRSVYFR